MRERSQILKPNERIAIEDLVNEWEISDMFEEKILDDPSQLNTNIAERSWGRKIYIEAGKAANISRQL